MFFIPLIFLTAFVISLFFFWHLNLSINRRLCSEGANMIFYTLGIRLFPVVIFIFFIIKETGYSGIFTFLAAFYLARTTYFKISLNKI